PTTITIDYSQSDGASAGGVVPGQLNSMSSVPDPNATLKQIRRGSLQQPVVPASSPPPRGTIPMDPAETAMPPQPYVPAPQVNAPPPQPFVAPPNPDQSEP